MKFTLSSIALLFLGARAAVAAPAPAAIVAPVEDRALMPRDYTSIYADQLTDGTACRDVTLIYGRGTGQSGNIGQTTDVGPEFFNFLAGYVGSANLAVAGVNYSASVDGFEEGGDPAGAQEMADLSAQALTQCPDTLLVLSGYSQGAQLVHLSADLISTKVTNFVAAVLMFGDPYDGDAVGSIPAAKVHTICHPLDGICLGLGIPTPAHLDYQDDADTAAIWVADYLGYST